jgi:hypothetical protein
MKIDASRGQQLDFAADGELVTGVIIVSEQTDGVCASMVVETEISIPNGALLSIPKLKCGSCGVADPVSQGGRIYVTLRVPNAYVNRRTVGK